MRRRRSKAFSVDVENTPAIKAMILAMKTVMPDEYIKVKQDAGEYFISRSKALAPVSTVPYTAKAQAKWGKRSGLLRDSIQWVYKPDRRGPAVVGIDRKQAGYAGAVIGGDSKRGIAPNPFWRQAREMTRVFYHSAARRALRDAVRKVARV